MSIDDVLSRVATLQQLAGAATSPTTSPAATPASAAAAPSFADALASATDASLPAVALPSPDATGADDTSGFGALGLGSSPASALLAQLALQSSSPTAPAAPTAAYPGASGARVLAAAETQLGVSEQPPGSNDGPALGAYRAAVAGSQPGQPWCADFASWAAAQAGEPLGDRGQGLGSVAEITDWASRTGKLLPATAIPAPGDLILFGDRHVGIVESVAPDGSLTTIEGNYGNAVSRVHRLPSEATGYVQL